MISRIAYSRQGEMLEPCCIGVLVRRLANHYSPPLCCPEVITGGTSLPWGAGVLPFEPWWRSTPLSWSLSLLLVAPTLLFLVTVKCLQGANVPRSTLSMSRWSPTLPLLFEGPSPPPRSPSLSLPLPSQGEVMLSDCFEACRREELLSGSSHGNLSRRSAALSFHRPEPCRHWLVPPPYCCPIILLPQGSHLRSFTTQEPPSSELCSLSWSQTKELVLLRNHSHRRCREEEETTREGEEEEEEFGSINGYVGPPGLPVYLLT